MSEAETKEVTFKTLSQESFKFTFSLSTKIGEIKKKIFDDKGENFEVERQKLIYNGKVLEDAKTLGDIDMDEKKYIVVMVSRKKIEQPAVAQISSSPNVAPAKTTAPVSTGESNSSAPTQPAPVASTPTVSAQDEEKISMLTAMGYTRDEVIRALRAAFGDADRAVEYLCNGIPQQTDAVADENLMEQDSGDDEDPLTFVRNSPQFAQICQLVQSQPQLLPQILSEIQSSNPNLFQIIRENPEAFLQLLNQGAETNDQEQEAEQADENEPMLIEVTQADRDAIDRMRSMGFSEQLVIEAYFACDKNEDLAINYILSRMDEALDGN